MKTSYLLLFFTVKRDRTVKLALDTKVLFKSAHKNRYQMPKVEILIDTIQQNFNANASSGSLCFTTLDLKYAYSQLNLYPETSRHCNLNLIAIVQRTTYIVPSLVSTSIWHFPTEIKNIIDPQNLRSQTIKFILRSSTFFRQIIAQYVTIVILYAFF